MAADCWGVGSGYKNDDIKQFFNKDLWNKIMDSQIMDTFLKKDS